MDVRLVHWQIAFDDVGYQASGLPSLESPWRQRAASLLEPGGVVLGAGSISEIDPSHRALVGVIDRARRDPRLEFPAARRGCVYASRPGERGEHGAQKRDPE